MIFATVGAQMPFNRLISALDEWAAQRGRSDVFAQIGPTAEHPRAITWTNFITPQDFRHRMEEAEAVVAHAGMGTIITALCLRKPIIIMPRRGDLMETRNDHQIATAERFADIRGVAVAMNPDELFARLDHVREIAPPRGIADAASDQLLSTIRAFIGGEAAAPIPPRAGVTVS